MNVQSISQFIPRDGGAYAIGMIRHIIQLSLFIKETRMTGLNLMQTSKALSAFIHVPLVDTLSLAAKLKHARHFLLIDLHIIQRSK